jgi:hypothetical protein
MSGNAQFRGMVWQIAEDYACADLLLRLPGHCPMPARSPPPYPVQQCTSGSGQLCQACLLLRLPGRCPTPTHSCRTPLQRKSRTSGSSTAADRAARRACAYPCIYLSHAEHPVPYLLRDLEVAFCMSRTARSKAALQQACVYAAVSGARVSLRAALSEVGVRQSYAERRTGVPGGRGRAARRAAPPQDARAGARSCMWGSEMHRCGAQERALASATWHARLKSSRERQRLPSPRSAHLCNRAVSRS